MDMSNDKNKEEVTLKDALQAMVEEYRMQSRLAQERLQKKWAQLMGPMIAQRTTELKMRKNTLYITIDSAALRQELSYDKEKLQRLLNKHLGEQMIEKIVLR